MDVRAFEAPCAHVRRALASSAAILSAVTCFLASPGVSAHASESAARAPDKAHANTKTGAQKAPSSSGSPSSAAANTNTNTNANANAPALTRARLVERFQRLGDFEANIVQLKRSPHLSRPLKSTIKLTRAQDSITWDILTPVRTTIVINREGLRFGSTGPEALSSPDHTATLQAQAAAPQMRALIGAIWALLNLDFTTLEKQFDVRIVDQTLTARPRERAMPPDAVPLPVRQLVLTFDARANPTELVIETLEDTSTLTFGPLRGLSAQGR